MKAVLLLSIMAALSGCKAIANSDEILESLKTCKETFKEECRLTPLPISSEKKIIELYNELKKEIEVAK